jgi:hypothetical protein
VLCALMRTRANVRQNQNSKTHVGRPSVQRRQEVTLPKPNRENGPTQLRRSGISPRWTNVADAYNDFYAVVLFYLSWGFLDRSL